MAINFATMRRKRQLHVAGAVAVLAGVTALLSGCSGLDLKNDSVIGPILEDLNPPTPGEAARNAFNMYDPDVRAKNIALLSAAPFGGEKKYVDIYRMMLGSTDSDSQIDAAPDPAPNVRATSLHALGRHGTVEDVQLIIPRLDRDLEQSEYVRWQAAQALQKIHNPQLAVDPLIDAMRNDGSADVRQAAATALGQYPDAGVYEELVAVLQDDTETNYSVIFAARTSLVTLTGQDFGNNGMLWTKWARENRESLFANQQEYTYQPYTKPEGLFDKVQFWKEKQRVDPKRPTGVDGAEQVDLKTDVTPEAPADS